MASKIFEGGAFLTIEEIIVANIKSGSHWFDESTTRYFDGEVHSLYGGRYLVHSSQFHGSILSDPRKWHIAYVLTDGTVETLPGAKTVTINFPSLGGAESFARCLEAGKLRVERYAYDNHLPCRDCPTYASWTVNGDALCFVHTGSELELWRERL